MDACASTRFADALKSGIGGSDWLSSTLARTPIYESVSEFNDKTIAFLRRNVG